MKRERSWGTGFIAGLLLFVFPFSINAQTNIPISSSKAPVTTSTSTTSKPVSANAAGTTSATTSFQAAPPANASTSPFQTLQNIISSLGGAGTGSAAQWANLCAYIPDSDLQNLMDMQRTIKGPATAAFVTPMKRIMEKYRNSTAVELENMLKTDPTVFNREFTVDLDEKFENYLSSLYRTKEEAYRILHSFSLQPCNPMTTKNFRILLAMIMQLEMEALASPILRTTVQGLPAEYDNHYPIADQTVYGVMWSGIDVQFPPLPQESGTSQCGQHRAALQEQALYLAGAGRFDFRIFESSLYLSQKSVLAQLEALGLSGEKSRFVRDVSPINVLTCDVGGAKWGLTSPACSFLNENRDTLHSAIQSIGWPCQEVNVFDFDYGKLRSFPTTSTTGTKNCETADPLALVNSYTIGVYNYGDNGTARRLYACPKNINGQALYPTLGHICDSLAAGSGGSTTSGEIESAFAQLASSAGATGPTLSEIRNLCGQFGPQAPPSASGSGALPSAKLPDIGGCPNPAAGNAPVSNDSYCGAIRQSPAGYLESTALGAPTGNNCKGESVSAGEGQGGGGPLIMAKPDTTRAAKSAQMAAREAMIQASMKQALEQAVSEGGTVMAPSTMMTQVNRPNLNPMGGWNTSILQNQQSKVINSAIAPTKLTQPSAVTQMVSQGTQVSTQGVQVGVVVSPRIPGRATGSLARVEGIAEKKLLSEMLPKAVPWLIKAGWVITILNVPIRIILYANDASAISQDPTQEDIDRFQRQFDPTNQALSRQFAQNWVNRMLHPSSAEEWVDTFLNPSSAIPTSNPTGAAPTGGTTQPSGNPGLGNAGLRAGETAPKPTQSGVSGTNNPNNLPGGDWDNDGIDDNIDDSDGDGVADADDADPNSPAKAAAGTDDTGAEGGFEDNPSNCTWYGKVMNEVGQCLEKKFAKAGTASGKTQSPMARDASKWSYITGDEVGASWETQVLLSCNFQTPTAPQGSQAGGGSGLKTPSSPVQYQPGPGLIPNRNCLPIVYCSEGEACPCPTSR